jgi:ADP-heptose:LPS heptosyltransferase
MPKYVFKKNSLKLLIGAIDIMGFIIFAPFMFFKRMSGKKQEPKKILVVRLDQTGDVIQALPFFAALRKKYPAAHIAALVTKNNEFLLAGGKYADRVFTLDTSWFYKNRKTHLAGVFKLAGEIKKLGFDLGFDLRGDMRNIFFLFLAGAGRICGYSCAGGGFLLDMEKPYDREEHEIDKNLKLIDAAPPAIVNIDFPAAAGDDEFVAGLLKETGTAGMDRIMIHPFAGGPSRLWGFDKYRQLVDRILETGKNTAVFITGGPEDEKFRNEFRFGPRIIDAIGVKFMPTIALMKKCGLFIGNDSSLQYFAAYSGVKTCVIYGYILNFKRWAPRVKSGNFIAFTRPVPCGPCEKAVCDNKGGHECMELITVDEVFNGIKKWIK